MKTKLNMKKLILLLTTAFLCLTGNAQTSDIANSINNIKRDRSYFYAESTSASEAEAKDAATIMLQSVVSEHNKQSGSSVDFNSLDVQYLQMMRGEYYRVFAYARKDGAKTVAVKVTETPQPKPAPKPASTPAPVSVVNESAQGTDNGLVAQIEQLKQELAEKDRQLKDLQDKLDAQRRENDRLNKLITEMKSGDGGNKITETKDSPMESHHNDIQINPSHQKVIDTLFQCANLNEVSAKLSRLQNEYTVKKYGTYEDCPNIASCYWIVLNRDSNMSMNTILSTGNEKTNLKTSQYDSLSKYTGHILIWFRL